MSAQEVQDLYKLHLELEAKMKDENAKLAWKCCMVATMFVIILAIHGGSMMQHIEELKSRIAALPTQKAPETPKPAATTTTPTKPRVMKELRVDDALAEGEILQSDDGAYELVMQRDGNLVLYRGKKQTSENAIWHSNTVKGDSASHPFALHFGRDKFGRVRSFFIGDARGRARKIWPFGLDEPEPAALKICSGRLTAISAYQSGGSSVSCPKGVVFIQ